MKLIDKYYKKNIERTCEITYLFDSLDKVVSNKKLKVLDVGFAGSWYIEDIINNYKNTIDYTGIDGDKSRILGKSFKTSQDKKNIWKNLISSVKCIHGDIITYVTKKRYDLIISISTIEHIVPLAYSNKGEFDLHLDIKAIEAMKNMLEKNGKLLLTFPCGEERLFFNPKNLNKDVLQENGFVKSGHSLIIYNKDRINKIIGNYKVLDEKYWLLNSDSYVEDNNVLNYKHDSSHVKALCTLLIEKP